MRSRLCLLFSSRRRWASRSCPAATATSPVRPEVSRSSRRGAASTAGPRHSRIRGGRVILPAPGAGGEVDSRAAPGLQSPDPRHPRSAMMPPAPLLTIHTDGASRGNPGQAAYAYTIEGEGIEPVEEAGRLGRMTNNQAEYTALVKALEHAADLGTHHRLLIRSDSELMVKQMRGEYQVKNGDLRGLYEQARELVKAFDGGVTLVHVRREHNKRADELGNEALDGLREPMWRPARAGRETKTTERETKRAPGAREEALDCLRRAQAAWSAGGAAPRPEDVRRSLVEVIQRHGGRVPD